MKTSKILFSIIIFVLFFLFPLDAQAIQCASPQSFTSYTCGTNFWTGEQYCVKGTSSLTCTILGWTCEAEGPLYASCYVDANGVCSVSAMYDPILCTYYPDPTKPPAPTPKPGDPTPTPGSPSPTSPPPQDCPANCSCVMADQCGGGKIIVPEYQCPSPYACCCGTGCFLAGTEISTINGDKKKIEDIGAKEIIQSLELVSGWFSTSQVGELKKTEREGYYLLKFIDSQFAETELKVTGEHPIFTLKDKKKPLLNSVLISEVNFTFLQGDFVKVEDLMIGDYVRTEHGWIKLIERTYIPEKVLVYNLIAASPYSNYFANDILVHNKNGVTGVGSINGRICAPSDPANPDADAACVVDGGSLDLYPGACNRTVVSNTKLCDDGPHETILDGITFDYWGVSTGDDPATKDIAEEDNRDVSYTNLMFNNDCFNCGACGQCGKLYFGPPKRGKYVIRINTPPGWTPVKCKTWYKDLFTFSGVNQCYFYVNYGGDDSGSYFAIKKATPPKCEFINPPSQVEVGKSYTIKVKATSQEPTMNIRKVTISRAQTNNFDATTGWREIKNITCNGQTCEGEGTWNVTSDDLTFEGNKWWLACNAFYNEDENGTNSTRCTGNPWSVPADWADCWPPYSGDQPGIDADAYDDKDSQEVTVCQNIAPGAPTNPSPANDVDLNTLPSSLSWRAPNSWGVCCPGHDNHYLVYLDDNSDFSSPVINGASTTATSYSLSGKVEAGKTYYWKVVAHNGCLTTPTPHAVWSFCINKAPDAATTLSDGIFRDNQNILLSWKNISNWGLNCAGNNNQYLVYYCKAGTGCTSTSVPETNRCLPIANNNPTTGFSSCTLAGPLDWESTYYWKVVTSNGALTNEAFSSFKITYPSAWWQTKTGDVYGSEIFSPIWREVPEAQRYFSLVGPFGSQSGLVAAPNCLGSSGARCNFGAAQATQTEFPTSGQGGINANFTPLLNDYSYDQLAHLVDLAIYENDEGEKASYNSEVKVISGVSAEKIERSELTDSDDADKIIYYYFSDSGSVSVDSPLTIESGDKKLIIFIDGDLHINKNITAPDFLAFIVSGDIEIAADVTQVQGVYFANGSLTVESNGAIDSQFNGQGIFVGKNGVSLERNFRSVANTTTPTEIFTFDPAYLFTAPKVFREKPYLWQEVIP